MKLIKVTEAKYNKDYIISFAFSDGTSGSVDFSDLLKGEVFEPLKEKETFKNFTLNPWTIEWENGADFAPEFLYELAKQSGISKSVA